jgi:acetylornithine deacetylase
VNETILASVDSDRLVQTAVDLVSIPSPTGSEQAMAEHVRGIFESMGLKVLWQEVEDGRPNVVGTLEGAGGGKSLMFNGHMDTSYSGQEPWYRGIAGFQPSGFVRDGRVWGLGISNMKGALACYVEAVRALQDAGVRLKGDVLIATVSGEIEKTQWGEYRGREYRGYSAGSRYLAAHGAIADMCILGEPTGRGIVLGHYGSIWLRVSTAGPFTHQAYMQGRLAENSIVKMRDVLDAVLEWIPEWQEKTAYGGEPGLVGLGALDAGFPWRVSRTPIRTDLFLDVRVPPTLPMTEATAELKAFCRGLRERFPEHGVDYEIYLSAPGSEIAEDHPLVQAIDACHTEVAGTPPGRSTVRWFSDASSLVRYGIESVNYGTSTGQHGDDGENLDIAGLVEVTKVYALTAARICELAAG